LVSLGIAAVNETPAVIAAQKRTRTHLPVGGLIMMSAKWT
jgi:hypothetical protein